MNLFSRTLNLIFILFMIVIIGATATAIDINSSSALQYYGNGNNPDLEVETDSETEISGIANFTNSQITFYEPLSLQSSGPMSVQNGIDLTDSSTNTIDSYSTFYLQTSSGSPSDIVLQPTGEVGVESNLSTNGRIDVNSNKIIDVTDPTNAQDAATKSYVDSKTGDGQCSGNNVFLDGEGVCRDLTTNYGNVIHGDLLQDNQIDNSEIQNGDSFTFNGVTSNSNVNMQSNNVTNAKSIQFNGDSGTNVYKQGEGSFESNDFTMRANNRDIYFYVNSNAGSDEMHFYTNDGGSSRTQRLKIGSHSGTVDLDVQNSRLDLNNNKLCGSDSCANFISGNTASFSNLNSGGGGEINVQSRVEMNANTLQSNDGSEFSISNLNSINDGFSVSGNLNFNNNDNIQSSGTNAITLDSGQNVGIPNGNLDVTGGGIDIDKTTPRLDLRGDSNDQGEIRYFESGTQRWRWRYKDDEIDLVNADNGNTVTFSYKNSGNVQIPNGNLDIGGPGNTGKTLDVAGGANFNGNVNLNNGGGLDNVNDIEMDGNIFGGGVDMSLQEVGSVLGPNNGDTDLNIQTQGGGSHVVSIEDGSSSNKDIAVFNEGTQNVGIPNGRLDINNPSHTSGKLNVDGAMNFEIDPHQINFESDNSARNFYDVKETGTVKWTASYGNENLQWGDAGNNPVLNLQQDQSVEIGGSPSNSGRTLDVAGGANLNDNLDMNSNNITSVQEIKLTSGTTINGSFDIENSNIDLNDNNLLDANNVYTNNLRNGDGGGGTIKVQDQLNMTSKKIIHVTNPTNPQDAATKDYVDSQLVTDSCSGSNVFLDATNTCRDITTNYGNVIHGDLLQSNQVDNSEIQNGDAFTFNGVTNNGNLNMANNGNIQSSGTNAITLDSGQNVGIPNGNLDLKSGFWLNESGTASVLHHSPGSYIAFGRQITGNQPSFRGYANNMRIHDPGSGNDNVIFRQGGDVEIRHGALDFVNSNNIQVSGTDVIRFDGSQNVDIPNGNLKMSNNQVDGVNQIDFNGGASIDEGTAQYGSIRLTGGEEGSWGGINVQGNRDVVVGMTDADGSGFSTGAYDDNNNNWIWQYDGSRTDLRYNGGWKIQTQSYGANINVDDSSDTDGIRLDGTVALTSDPSDGWLRLNQNNNFGKGVYTPGLFRADGGAEFRGTVNMKGNSVDNADDVETNDIYDDDSNFLRVQDSIDLNNNDAKAIDFDGGDAMVTIHDGTGNFNLKSGVNENGNIVSGSGGTHVRMNDNGKWQARIDESTSAGNSFTAETTATLDSGKFSVGGGNLDVNSNNIQDISNLYQDDSSTNFFSPDCSNGKVLTGIDSDGSYTCVSSSSQITDKWVNETGDTMSGNLEVNAQLTTDSAAFGVSESTGSSELSDSTVYVGGNLEVADNILGRGGDVAENVNTEGELEEGEIAVIGGNMSIQESDKRYDRTVAGVISTDPGVTLAKERGGEPLALTGIVPVKVTVSNGEIEPGDRLTVSDVPGTAMKCQTRERCEGAIIGKAMQGTSENGKINVLLTMG